MLKFFKKKLPDCDTLFERFLSPWYPVDERPKMTRPDMYQIAGFEGEQINFDTFQYLKGKTLENSKGLINETMINAAFEDYQNIISFKNFDFTVLDAVDKYFDKEKILDLIKESDPGDISNPYLVTVCEFGTMLGHLFQQIDGYDWLYSFPYFHSIIVHRDTGMGITVFDWAVKKLSGYGVDDGYVAKFYAALRGVDEFAKKNNL